MKIVALILALSCAAPALAAPKTTEPYHPADRRSDSSGTSANEESCFGQGRAAWSVYSGQDGLYGSGGTPISQRKGDNPAINAAWDEFYCSADDSSN